jgi:hypothetical protein
MRQEGTYPVFQANDAPLDMSRRARKTSTAEANYFYFNSQPFYANSFNVPYLRRARPIRPIWKAKASGWENGSTFCSRGPARQLARRP